jgi:hypothetical protein
VTVWFRLGHAEVMWEDSARVERFLDEKYADLDEAAGVDDLVSTLGSGWSGAQDEGDLYDESDRWSDDDIREVSAGDDRSSESSTSLVGSHAGPSPSKSISRRRVRTSREISMVTYSIWRCSAQRAIRGSSSASW